ncbi:hypothetical protein [Nostoc sp.]
MKNHDFCPKNYEKRSQICFPARGSDPRLLEEVGDLLTGSFLTEQY